MNKDLRREAIGDAAYMVADQYSDPRIYHAAIVMVRHGLDDKAARYVGRKYRQLIRN